MVREELDWKRFTSQDLVDYFGFDIHEGNILLRPQIEGHIAVIVRCVVTSIENGKIYLDNSKVPIKFPGRCINLTAVRMDL